MAASDYTITGQGSMIPYGVLELNITHLDTTFSIDKLNSNDPAAVKVGMTVLMGDEIMKVASVALPVIGVDRGCADTIPQAHLAGEDVWFFNTNLGTDDREYVAGSTIGVKLLPFTAAGDQVPIEYVNPLELEFNWRFIRPYPPGNFQCQGAPWFNDPFVVAPAGNDLVFTWAHRDRLLQADQLTAHQAGSIGPEPGTTYVAKVYSQQYGLKRTVTGITGTTWTYTRTMAEEDLSTGGFGYVVIYSIRDGYESRQSYRTDFEFQGVSGSWELALTLSSTSYTPPDGDAADLQFSSTPYSPPISN